MVTISYKIVRQQKPLIRIEAEELLAQSRLPEQVWSLKQKRLIRALLEKEHQLVSSLPSQLEYFLWPSHSCSSVAGGQPVCAARKPEINVFHLLNLHVQFDLLLSVCTLPHLHRSCCTRCSNRSLYGILSV